MLTASLKLYYFSFLLIAVKYKYNKYRGKLRVWIGLACLSALFAGVTAVLAKIGLKIVWQYAPVSTNEITDRLMKTTSWGAKTIQTLIKRLTNKGALTYEKEGRVYVYTPLVKENEYISQQSNSFLRRFYDGDITAMLSAYIKNDRLSAEEIGTLRSILDDADNDKGN